MNLEYGRLGKYQPGRNRPDTPLKPQLYPAPTTNANSKIKLLLIFALALIVVSLLSVGLVVHLRTKSPQGGSRPIIHPRPTEAMSRVCARTRYQNLCLNSLLDFPGSSGASDKDMIHISVNMTLQRVGRALYTSAEISNLQMNTRVRSAYEDCLELLEDSVDQLKRSLFSVVGKKGGSSQDVMTWLSAALTNQDTCTDGLSEVENGYVKQQMEGKLQDLSKLVSNCLAIYAAASDGDDFNGVPIQHRRRRLMSYQPEWLKRKERRLLQAPIGEIQADIVVSQDGNGTCKTIAEAIKKAPEYSNRRTIIYVRAGRYEEANLKVGRKKWNLMFIGDGKGKTVITGGVNVVVNNVTTFHTASFAATGSGFIARDMTFENYAGPAKHQAVALRVGADKAVVYRCNVIGYQDTLYVHSQRQFFRECDIYGTVDFIFGNAAVVFQNCSMYARKPMPLQKVTITAQNRKDPNQNTGISIHACRLLAQPDMEAAKSNFSTYLGRPWKLYSRTVYMQTYMGDHIHPRGWLEWNATFALDTLYYGEYMNYGPGGAIGQRVKWPGYRVITAAVEASRFTVAQFIYGSSWLPSTGVAFLAGLSQ
ncbi:putative pectinesterase [Helianthus annuus]|uniref:Pectinesterase n=1 Tax=Helianthus annuus TaxID=4232 RepID=A0A251UWQ5_HELAN|nr:probable pectinesterase/pectinesterase inhibitor 61 [Helianthus annuus]KAF5771442.1 putative pectinesterase [Helianthus annuus]KAJ0471304.1 putative pectinesterase [Helianthus annuus]KAJ0842618.1 putative pectinesterase [Helianthus annuus]